MKRIKGVVAATGIAALLLSACGGESDEPAAKDSASAKGDDKKAEEPADGAESTEARSATRAPTW